MDLISVKYQDSCIYIGLDGSQGQGIDQKSLEGIKNVYAVYKIIAWGNFVRDTILIRKQDILTVRGEMIVKFELNQLHRPDECELEIVSLKFVYYSGKREELIVKKVYSLLEIRTYSQVSVNKNRLLKRSKIEPKKTSRLNKESLSMTQEVFGLPQKTPETKIPIEDPILISKKDQDNQDQDQDSQEKITVIDELNPLSTVVSEIESKIERKLDAQTKKLEMDIKTLCYETIDLLLTSLPQPEFTEDYRSSETMLQSIHKYINADLLLKEQEEGQSA